MLETPGFNIAGLLEDPCEIRVLEGRIEDGNVRVATAYDDDRDLLPELDLPCDELSLPLRSLANLPIRKTTIVIVENRLNLLTLPALKRAIGIRGEGKAVTRLHRLNWLHDNRIIYWGDIDVDGFLILLAA